jgi:hypothetical protein
MLVAPHSADEGRKKRTHQLDLSADGDEVNFSNKFFLAQSIDA